MNAASFAKTDTVRNTRALEQLRASTELALSVERQSKDSSVQARAAALNASVPSIPSIHKSSVLSTRYYSYDMAAELTLSSNAMLKNIALSRVNAKKAMYEAAKAAIGSNEATPMESADMEKLSSGCETRRDRKYLEDPTVRDAKYLMGVGERIDACI